MDDEQPTTITCSGFCGRPIVVPDNWLDGIDINKLRLYCLDCMRWFSDYVTSRPEGE